MVMRKIQGILFPGWQDGSDQVLSEFDKERIPEAPFTRIIKINIT